MTKQQTDKELAQKDKKKHLAIIEFLLVGFLVFSLNLILPDSGRAIISLDDDMSDWAGAVILSDPFRDSGNCKTSANTDVLEFAVFHDNNYLYFFWVIVGQIYGSQSSFWAGIDADNNASTGYSGAGLEYQAEYVDYFGPQPSYTHLSRPEENTWPWPTIYTFQSDDYYGGAGEGKILQLRVPRNRMQLNKTIRIQMGADPDFFSSPCTDTATRPISYRLGGGSPPVVTNPVANPEKIPNDGSISAILTASVTDPDSDRDLASVVIDLSPLGRSSFQVMYDDGTNGDVVAGDGVYSAQTTAALSTPIGLKAFKITATDQNGNTGSNVISLLVTSTIIDTVQAQSSKSHGIFNGIDGQTLSLSYFLVGSFSYHILQAGASQVTLTVKNPDGEIYATETMSTSVNTISIPNAEAGTWTYEVNNEDTTQVSYQIDTVTSGIGILIGTVTNATTQRNLSGVNIATDTGGVALTVDGYYVMVTPAGVFTVTASSLSYRVESETNVALNAGEAVSVDFTLTAVPVNTNEIIVNLNSPPPLGNPVTIDFEATGPTASLSYKFWQASGYQTPDYGNWQVLRNWSAEKLLSWTPDSDDHYVIVAYITDDSASGGFHQAGLSLETAGNRANPILIRRLTTNLSYPQSKGTTVNLDTTATGGDGPLLYRYWQKQEPGGTWSMIQDYSSETSCSWIPAESGVYIIVVWVTDDPSVSEPPLAGMTCTIGE